MNNVKEEVWKTHRLRYCFDYQLTSDSFLSSKVKSIVSYNLSDTVEVEIVGLYYEIIEENLINL